MTRRRGDKLSIRFVLALDRGAAITKGRSVGGRGKGGLVERRYMRAEARFMKDKPQCISDGLAKAPRCGAPVVNLHWYLSRCTSRGALVVYADAVGYNYKTCYR